MKYSEKTLVVNFICFVAFFVVLIGLIVADSCITRSFDKGCKYQIELAINAHLIESAYYHLSMAIKYSEENNLTNGFSSKTHHEDAYDIGIWYHNLKECQDELTNFKTAESINRFELLKTLKQSLTNSSGSVYVPKDIEYSPHYQCGNILSNIEKVMGFILFLSILLMW